ncbi:MAG TPA: hypothetical protein V6C78_14975 [Crinalium sp.]
MDALNELLTATIGLMNLCTVSVGEDAPVASLYGIFWLLASDSWLLASDSQTNGNILKRYVMELAG